MYVCCAGFNPVLQTSKYNIAKVRPKIESSFLVSSYTNNARPAQLELRIVLVKTSLEMTKKPVSS